MAARWPSTKRVRVRIAEVVAVAAAEVVAEVVTAADVAVATSVTAWRFSSLHRSRGAQIAVS